MGSGVTGWGGQEGRMPPPPMRLLTRKFLLTYLEKRGKENCKRKGGKLKMEGGKVTKWGEDLFFFFFFFFFLFSFFFFFASHFSKPLKYVLGLLEWTFSTGKKHFTPGKKSGKMTLPPQKNFPVTPWAWVDNVHRLWSLKGPWERRRAKHRQEFLQTLWNIYW